jgi:hypothetical protein
VSRLHRLSTYVGLGLLGLGGALLTARRSAIAGDRAAESAAMDICAWEQSEDSEAELDRKLGVGPQGRDILSLLRDEKTVVACVPTSSRYSDSIGERAVAIQKGGRDLVSFRIVATSRGPRVLGYWMPAPDPSPT